MYGWIQLPILLARGEGARSGGEQKQVNEGEEGGKSKRPVVKASLNCYFSN